MTGASETLSIDAFIEARLRQDEAIARAATPGPWRYDPTKEHVEINTGLRSEGVFTGPDGPDAICVATTGDSDDRPSMRDARFIARHDPERVLREVAWKRHLLGFALAAFSQESKIGERPGRDPETNAYDKGRADTARFMLRLLAMSWSSHPDFRAEWTA